MRIFTEEKPGSVFVQVLDWMLAPLVVLWPAAVLGTYFAAAAIADAPFDRELRERVEWIVEAISGARTRAELEARLRPVQLNAFERFYFQVYLPGDAVLAGDSTLPRVPPREARAPGAIAFREDFLEGERLRVAFQVVTVAGAALVVQVAEPLTRRQELAGGMTVVVMFVIALLVPATVALVWFGLRRGLAPLERLRERIEARERDDLSPIPPEEAPYEIAPLVDTLNVQLERVRRSLEAQRRFVADAAHQMKTPLAGLKTQAEAAQRGTTLEDARDRLARIEEGADRMSRLVAQLLALARADDARSRSQPRERVDLIEIMRMLCEEWGPRAAARGLALSFDAPAGEAAIEGAPLLLREMFANLLDNAIRYTPEGGEVAVRVEDGPRVLVEDTGIGIAPAERELVFGRFYRVLGTGASGSGLGLAIVKEIADVHGARVRVESGADGRGTRFVVDFG